MRGNGRGPAIRRNARGSRPARAPSPPVELDPSAVTLTSRPDGSFDISAGALSLRGVRVRLGRPLTAPDDFACVLSEEGEELAVLPDLRRLPEAARSALSRMQRRHDLRARVVTVRSLTHQLGSSYWDVETDRGRREFVMKGASEHVRWLSDDRLLVSDIDGNRFEIASLSALDPRSQALVRQIL